MLSILCLRTVKQMRNHVTLNRKLFGLQNQSHYKLNVIMFKTLQVFDTILNSKVQLNKWDQVAHYQLHFSETSRERSGLDNPSTIDPGYQIQDSGSFYNTISSENSSALLYYMSKNC